MKILDLQKQFKGGKIYNAVINHDKSVLIIRTVDKERSVSLYYKYTLMDKNITSNSSDTITIDNNIYVYDVIYEIGFDREYYSIANTAMTDNDKLLVITSYVNNNNNSLTELLVITSYADNYKSLLVEYIYLNEDSKIKYRSLPKISIPDLADIFKKVPNTPVTKNNKMISNDSSARLDSNTNDSTVVNCQTIEFTLEDSIIFMSREDFIIVILDKLGLDVDDINTESMYLDYGDQDVNFLFCLKQCDDVKTYYVGKTKNGDFVKIDTLKIASNIDIDVDEYNAHNGYVLNLKIKL